MEQELKFEQPQLEQPQLEADPVAVDQVDLDQVMAAAASVPDALLGKILGGHYQVESKLGSGGMSVVYKARHLHLDKYVAIKVVSHERVLDGKSIQRFAQEAKAAANLSHPNIVAAREFGVDQDGHPFLVMDFVEGESLEKSIAREGKIEVARAFDIIAQVCDGLMHAHEKGIVHRDIKPGNIVVSQEGGKEIARILDFGIAKITNQAQGQTLTQTGEVFGSPIYMSPEQCHGKKLDTRSDIYSLGCVIAEMLTGKRPFEGQSALESLMKHINDEPELDPNLPQAAEKLIMKALEKDVTKRYQTVAELARDLDAAQASMSGGNEHRKKRKRRVKTKSRWSKGERIVAWVVIPLLATIAAAGALLIGRLYFQPEWQKTLYNASVLEQHQMWNEAAQVFTRALDLAQREQDGRSAEEEVRQSMGEFYFSRAQLQQSTREYSMYEADLGAEQMKEALKIVWDHGTDFQKAHLLDDLGQVEQFMHKYGAAEGYYRDAVQNRKSYPGDQNKWLAGTLMRQGTNYQDEKKYDLALKSYLKAADELQRGGDKFYLVDCYRELAEIESQLKDYIQANNYYDQCIKLIESTTGKGDERWNEVHSQRADVLDKLGKTSEAAALRKELK